ncbi:MAG TPA: tryptophan synthase subunit alpha [Actinomycetales bacterium]|nr:tryptophan synthase subunit alpha [Actinomycetales bacterium]
MSANVTSGVSIDKARAEGRSSLITYLPVGFPSVEGTVAAAKAAIAEGTDVVELGLPYTDPMMDGGTIQRAVEHALGHGTKVADVLRAVEKVATTGAAVLVMTYWNPIFRYGVDRWARDFSAAGGAGLITPDIIPEEAADWIAAADERDLDRVFLVAPSSTPERLRLTAAASRGFVYAASTMGVTGERASVGALAEKLVADTRAAGADRVCLGLGVSTAEQAKEIAQYSDGVIVGSAYVRAMFESADASGVFNTADVARAAGAVSAELRGGIEAAR